MMNTKVWPIWAGTLVLCLSMTAAQGSVFTWAGAGLASDSANWLEDGAATVNTPDFDDTVQLDATSTADLEWDLNTAVAGWDQQSAYAGTVTVNTTYGGAFQTFSVLNDLTIAGGSWTHQGNETTQDNRLKVDVGGNFTIGAGGAINTNGKGYGREDGPGKGAWWPPRGGSYGGRAGGNAGKQGNSYGSMTEPVDLGSGGGRGNDEYGGGAVYLTVAGHSQVDGQISSLGAGAVAPGSGGSVYLQTATLAGSGSIDASSIPSVTGGGGSSGSGGGRVAVVLTAGETFGSVAMKASGAADTGGFDGGGAGTVYTQKASQGAGQGKLLIDNDGVLGEWTNWTEGSAGGVDYTQLAEIEIRGKANLAIRASDTFDFSTANITGAGAGEAFITVVDGTNVTYGQDMNISGYTFIPMGVTTIDGNVTVASDGGVSHISNGGAQDYRLVLTVDGDLVVQAGGEIDVDARGYRNGSGGPYGSGAGWSPGVGASHGGQGESSDANTYGSILAPEDLGAAGIHGSSGSYGGGGAAVLTVTGDTVLDGIITADGAASSRGAAGGSVFLTTGSLSGSGSIGANGATGHVGGGGGRVAVILTNSDGFAGVVFAAFGGADGAGGSVYLQELSDGLGGGEVLFDFGGINANAVAHLPASAGPGANDDLSAAKVRMQNSARVGLTGDTMIGDLNIDAGSTLFLNGYTLTVDVQEHALAGTVDDSLGGQIVWVPEPASGLLLALTGLAALRRRRTA